MKNLSLSFTFLTLICILCNQTYSYAEDNPMYVLPRVGIGNKVEKLKIIQKEPRINTNILKEKNKKESDPTFAEIDSKKIADELKGDLEEEKPEFLEDLKILWEAAIERSETIRFAILKLSNPNGDQEKKSVVKKILSPLASVTPFVGAGSPDPITAGSAVLGGTMLGSLLSDNSALNNHLSKVTDTDLVLLAQEIDNLQQKLVILYYNYLNAVERLEMSDRLLSNRYNYYQKVQKSQPEIISVADVFYREAIDTQYKARQEVLTSRAALEQFVGTDALNNVDKNIKARLATMQQLQ